MDKSTTYRLLNYLDKLSGGQGLQIFSNTAAHTIEASTIVPREDTVISALEIDGEDVMAAENSDNVFNITGVTLKANFDLLVAPVGKKFTKLTLASGSVACYKADVRTVPAAFASHHEQFD